MFVTDLTTSVSSSELKASFLTFSEEYLRFYGVKDYSKYYKSGFLCLLPKNILIHRVREICDYQILFHLSMPSLTC